MGRIGFLFAQRKLVLQMRLNSKTCKVLRKEARRIADQMHGLARGAFTGVAHYAARKYKEVHRKEAQVNPATGKPFRERDTGKPIMLDVVERVALPIRLSDGSGRSLYRTLKKLHALRPAGEVV